jgi:O-acetyl-ADP-ribose deacetylase (regulator of RNase III)
MPCKYVFHAIAPIYGKEMGYESYMLEQCVINALKLAEELGLRSIAFTPISTGVFHYPIELCAESFFTVLTKYFEAKRPLLKTIRITSHKLAPSAAFAEEFDLWKEGKVY